MLQSWNSPAKLNNSHTGLSLEDNLCFDSGAANEAAWLLITIGQCKGLTQALTVKMQQEQPGLL